MFIYLEGAGVHEFPQELEGLLAGYPFFGDDDAVTGQHGERSLAGVVGVQEALGARKSGLDADGLRLRGAGYQIVIEGRVKGDVFNPGRIVAAHAAVGVQFGTNDGHTADGIPIGRQCRAFLLIRMRAGRSVC